MSEGGKAGAIRQIFAQAYGVDPETLRFEDVGAQALKGEISDQAFIDGMNRRHPHGRPVSMEAFIATVDHLAPCQPVYKLAAALRRAGIITGIMSNTLRVTADSLRERGLYDNFEPLLLSCDEHLAKPQAEFYKRALKRLGFAAEEVIFIDDQEVFLAPARKLGIHTIRADSPNQIVADTKALIQKENGIEL